MSEIMMSIPDRSLSAQKVTASQAATEVRLAAAMKHYELVRLSRGAVAGSAWRLALSVTSAVERHDTGARMRLRFATCQDTVFPETG